MPRQLVTAAAALSALVGATFDTAVPAAPSLPAGGDVAVILSGAQV